MEKLKNYAICLSIIIFVEHELMESISNAELILTPEGKIYHLDIFPDAISNLIITVGDPKRVGLVSQFFDSIEFNHTHREFTINTGYYRDVKISVISSGIGTQNIDILLNELDALVNIDLQQGIIKENHSQLTIFRFGTSGSIQADLPVGSYVVATHGIDMTNVSSFYFTKHTQEEKKMILELKHYLKKNYPIMPIDIYTGSKELIDVFRTIKPYKLGITAACNGFYAPQGRELRVKSRVRGFPEYLSRFSYENMRVTNFEMETGTIYGLGSLLGHRCCSVNVILANRIRNEFVEDVESLVTDFVKLNLDTIVSKMNNQS